MWLRKAWHVELNVISIIIIINHIFSEFWDSYKYKNMDKITRILENVVRYKYFEAGVHINNPIKNSYQDGLGRTTQTLDPVVVVHILIWDKRKSQINEYNDIDENWLMKGGHFCMVFVDNITIREKNKHNAKREEDVAIKLHRRYY
jgi:hypothetical protein